MILQPHQGDHALSLLGGGTLRMHGEGEFAARDLHLWINESPDPQVAARQTAFPLSPLRMLAEGDVRVDSWQLAGTTQRAEIWIRHEDRRSGHAGGRPANRRPGSRPTRPTARSEIRSGRRPPADRNSCAGVKRRFVEHLILDGQVRFREVRTEKAGDVPLAIVGDLVQVDHANTNLARVHVQGRPSEVSARGLTVVADTIQLDRGDNRIWINSPGKMLLPPLAGRRRGRTGARGGLSRQAHR